MGTRVQIMDLELDLLTQETFEAEISAYLSNEVLNVVHMISLDYIDTYDENELVRQVLAEADMVLPGENAILSAHHVDVLETGGMVVNYECLAHLYQDLLKDKTFYLICRSEKEAKDVFRFASKYIASENILGVYAARGSVTEEALINDINTKLPDIILVSMESTDQEEWLSNNRSKLNAKLCFVVGSILPHFLRQNVLVPAWLEKIHLGGLYRAICRIPNAHFVRRRIFNRKMDSYASRKQQEEEQ